MATGRSATTVVSQNGGSGGGIGGASPRRSLNPLVQDVQLPCGLLPSQVSDLLDRDITPDDYEMLMQLDHANHRPTASAEIVKRLPASDAKAAIGESCSVCLLTFQSDDNLAMLACEHVFHRQCISKWLLERCRFCPLCGAEADTPPAA